MLIRSCRWGFAFVIIMLTGCAGWTVNGIECSKFRNLTPKQGVALAGGILASNAVHFAGHVLAYEVMRKPWHVDGWRYEVVDGPLSNGEAAWAGRAGFLAQLAGGFALHLADERGWFATGYHIGTAFEMVTYPAFNQKVSDLKMIDRGGSGMAEWRVYSALSIYLLNADRKER